jgi:DNA segregation ATPase FtsK/SpoIIIE, S-DNA-T family
MAITLQVRDVREEIYRSAGRWESADPGAPSTMLLGRLFHEIFAELVGPDERKNFVETLNLAESSEEDWTRALVEHTYRRLMGPKLRRHQAELKFQPEQVLIFWDAVQELCRWMAKLFWKAHAENVDLKQATIAAEEPLRWELRDPEWTDSVILTGVADAVWRLKARQKWCVVELKTGRDAPEADLAQACLHQQILIASGLDADGAPALMSFGPQLEEKLFSAEQIIDAQWRLRRLIGGLAGVI